MGVGMHPQRSGTHHRLTKTAGDCFCTTSANIAAQRSLVTRYLTPAVGQRAWDASPRACARASRLRFRAGRLCARSRRRPASQPADRAKVARARRRAPKPGRRRSAPKPAACCATSGTCSKFHAVSAGAALCLGRDPRTSGFRSPGAAQRSRGSARSEHEPRLLDQQGVNAPGLRC